MRLSNRPHRTFFILKNHVALFRYHPRTGADTVSTGHGAACKFKCSTANRCEPNGSSALHRKFFFLNKVKFKLFYKNNPLKGLIMEKQGKYLYIWSSRRNIGCRICKTKFSHRFAKFKMEMVGNGQQQCVQWEHR